MQKKSFSGSDVINYRLSLLKRFTDSISRDVVELSNHLLDLTQNRSGNESYRGLKEQLRDYEEQLIKDALQKSGGNQVKAAEMLRIKPTTLNSKIKRNGISLDSLFTFPSNNGNENPD
jgi:DNA-binding NtrC family response regulator